MSLSIPSEHIPPGMKDVHIGSPFLPAAMQEISTLGSKKVFVLANKSSRKFIDGDGEKFVDILQDKGLLAAPLCTSIGMGGGEEGLLQACDEAYAADADAIVTVGGGAVQDAGKFIRLWLSTKGPDQREGGATVQALQAASKRDPMPDLPPQIAIPNSFALAEATHVAGLITTTSKTKCGIAHKSVMPTVIIYDPALSAGLPDWVRFGTALRGVEHAVGAVTHPKANEDIRARALMGLKILDDNLKKLVKNPECPTTQSNVYVGGFIAIRALNTGCYPAIGHFVQNQYSARFDVHQGSCSGITCARIMDYHYGESKVYQRSISEALGNKDTPAPILVRDLVATLPAVISEHAQAKVTDEQLKELTEYMCGKHLQKCNALSPKEFKSANDFYEMLTKPLADLGA